MEFEHDFGTFIRARLRTLDISQSEAAKRGGFSRQSLMNWMKGDVRRIELLNIVRLANVLNVSPYFCLQYLCKELSLEIRSDADALHEQDHASFVRDVSIPDNLPVLAGQSFFKEWEMMNTGNTVWEGRRLQCMDSEAIAFENGLVGGCLRPDEPSVPIPRTEPGRSVIIGVNLTAPGLPGTVRSEWKMVDRNGEICLPEHTGIWCQVRVVRV